MLMIIALLSVLAGACFWMNRAPVAHYDVDEVTDTEETAADAANKVDHAHKSNTHRVISIDDAVNAAGFAVASSDATPSPAEKNRDSVMAGLQKSRGIASSPTGEMAALSH